LLPQSEIQVQVGPQKMFASMESHGDVAGFGCQRYYFSTIRRRGGEIEGKDGGTTVVEDEVLLQKRDHSGVLLERCHRSTLASGLPLFRLFPQQNLCFSVPFWSLSLSFFSVSF
jgi:hypothetical protein